MAKVAVIVPVYNVEKYLARCLDSLLDQDYEDYQIVCVNDQSPDNSQAILDAYEAKYPEKIKCFMNPVNTSCGGARMLGMAETQSEYVMFVDSDDYVARDYISTYLKEIESTKSDVVVGGFIRDVEGKLTRHKAPKGAWGVLVYVISCAKMYRKSFLLKHNLGFSNIRTGEDIYFSMSLFYSKAKITGMDYEGYYYYCNNTSITRAMNYESNHECFVSEIYSKFLADFDISKLSEKRRRAIEYTYIANMVNALITYDHGCKPKLMKKKYEYVMKDMKEKFPDYKHNPYIGIFKPRGAHAKVRVGVGILMGLQRVKLDLPALYLISLF